MKQHGHKSSFTLVEVLIAMGICVFGVCSIMVLFPIGATASRDSVMYSYADDAALQIKSLIEYSFSSTKGTPESRLETFKAFTGWDVDASDWTNEKTNKYHTLTDEEIPVPPVNQDAIVDSKYGYNSVVKGKFTSVSDAIITMITQGSSDSSEENMRFRTYSTEKGMLFRADFKKYGDFSCWISVWPEPIKETVNGKEEIVPSCVTFHIEVAWPADLPAERRQKTYYDFDVFMQEQSDVENL